MKTKNGTCDLGPLEFAVTYSLMTPEWLLSIDEERLDWIKNDVMWELPKDWKTWPPEDIRRRANHRLMDKENIRRWFERGALKYLVANKEEHERS